MIRFIFGILVNFLAVNAYLFQNEKTSHLPLDTQLPDDNHVIRVTINRKDKNEQNIANAIVELKSSLLRTMNITVITNICDDRKNSCFFQVEYFSPVHIDRSCLLENPINQGREYFKYDGHANMTEVFKFLHDRGGFLIDNNGQPSKFGDHVMALENEFFSVDDDSEKLCPVVEFEDFMNESSNFFKSFWLKQRPVIINSYPTLPPERLINSLLATIKRKLSVKLSPSIEFEGIDSVENWSSVQKIPAYVLRKLIAPELVVTRPSHITATVCDILDMLAISSASADTNFSAYVEYLPIEGDLLHLFYSLLPLGLRLPSSLSRLLGRDSVSGPSEVNTVGKAHLWLGNGRTVGMMHFDPFDNIIVQIDGSKTFYLTDPSRNERFFEGHMREAEIDLYFDNEHSACQRESVVNDQCHSSPWIFNNLSSLSFGIQAAVYGKFKKERLSESTSMVHSPLGSLKFPNKKFDGGIPIDAYVMKCEVKAGQALYVPSFWWHEVYSSRGVNRSLENLRPCWTAQQPISMSPKEIYESALRINNYGGKNVAQNFQLNAAVNFWFPPLFNKEFPCASCRKKLNRFYRIPLEIMFNEDELMIK
jgi:jumonji domain-containing protein 7